MQPPLSILTKSPVERTKTIISNIAAAVLLFSFSFFGWGGRVWLQIADCSLGSDMVLVAFQSMKGGAQSFCLNQETESWKQYSYSLKKNWDHIMSPVWQKRSVDKMFRVVLHCVGRSFLKPDQVGEVGVVESPTSSQDSWNWSNIIRSDKLVEVSCRLM